MWSIILGGTMSKFVLPATRMVKALEGWLTMAFNDQRAALKALNTPDEEEHKGALVTAHAYIFAIKAAHDAIYSQQGTPDTVDSPEKRVAWFANKLLEELAQSEGVNLAQVEAGDNS